MTLKNKITETQAQSFGVDIFIAGDRRTATEACRQFCMEGLCVSITEADFVYTGGMESGVRIGLINYPRFPTSYEALQETGLRLGRFLIERLHQSSCTVVCDRNTHFLSRRSDVRL
jgi:hypothetical protein